MGHLSGSHPLGAAALGTLSGSHPFPEEETPKVSQKRRLLCLFVLAPAGWAPQGALGNAAVSDDGAGCPPAFPPALPEHQLSPLCCLAQQHPLPALFCVEVQAMKELHQELLSPAPKMSPFIVIGTLCTYYIHTLIGYASYFI